MGHSQILDHFFEEQHHKWKKRAHDVYERACKEYGIRSDTPKGVRKSGPEKTNLPSNEQDHSNRK